MLPPLKLSIAEARRFHRRAVLLDQPVADIGQALNHHGYVQIDPINVCGRIHDLLLRNRIENYAEGDLMRFLHGSTPLGAEDRRAFEHHLPHSNNLAALPLDAWPFLLAAMRQRTAGEGWWSGKLNDREERLAHSILQTMAERGPLSSEHIENEESARQGWGASATLAKTTLQKLFFHGRILIARRDKQRRLYDLPERVLPSATLATPEPAPEETARWITLLKLRQLRLSTLLKNEIPAVGDVIQPIAVEGFPMLYSLRSDLPLLDASAALSDEPLLLSPLDPLIYNRRITQHIWDFEYTWEVYTPAAKRVRGYYALPVLAGLEIVGHIDPKADRKNRRLVVVNRSIRRGYAAAPAVKSLARFLGLR